MSKTGLITQRKLRQITRSILDFLKGEDIDSIESLEKRLGESFDVKGKDHTIQIESSGSGSKAYTITYIDPKGGVPIEIKLNPNFNSKILVKTKSRLTGYTPIISDYFGNIVQKKIIDGCSISEIKRELEKLVS